MPTAAPTPPTQQSTIPARQFDPRNVGAVRSASAYDADALRRQRIDAIEHGKSRYWTFNLRMTELVNFALLVPAILFLWYHEWAWWALVPACATAVGGMWVFARRMRPREVRLCRHMVFIARHRRRCAKCRYCIQGLPGPCCPECGFAFDPNDDRHLLIPIVNRMYSHQGRQVAAAAIAAGMMAIVLLAKGADWRWHVGWSLALLAVLHALFAIWVVQARRQQREFEQAGVRPFSDRPDPRRPADWRIQRLQYAGVLLRWGMLTAICGGLAVLVNLDTSVLRVLSFGGGANMLVVTLGVPVLAYVLGVGVLMRYFVSRLMGRMRVMFAEVD